MEQLKIQEPNEEELMELFEQLEFRTMMRRKQIQAPSAPKKTEPLQGDLFSGFEVQQAQAPTDLLEFCIFAHKFVLWISVTTS